MQNAWIVARATAMALLIAAIGVGFWTWIAPLNARMHPEWPWAAGATLAFLALMLLWLNGVGPPRAWRDFRRDALRLQRPNWNEGALGIVAMIALMYVAWIVASLGQPTPDLSAYPTPAYRISIVLIGALVSGVVEEVAFRGYMQSQLERFGPVFAIGLTSLVFALSHITHGWEALLIMAPGYLFAGVLFGLLAWRTGSILPGIVLHVTGDAAHTIFAVLGGDVSLLLQSA